MSDLNIPLSEPYIDGNESKYVKECLDTGWVSSVGAYVTRFEKMVADYVQVRYAVATVNGTSALHLSLLAAGVHPDDEVIVPTLTFIAPVNTVRYCNAHPVFMDCDPGTLCLDIDKVRDFIMNECEQRADSYAYNKKTKRRVKAVIPVHIFGHPADMAPLIDVCHSFNIDIIEDATESLGSQYKDRKTGSLGKAGCLSFNGNKIITTGGGGMIVTDDEELARRTRHLSTQAKSDPFEYDHDEIGYNYRLTNIQAAMGVAQMERISEFVDIKRKNALIYKELFAGCEVVSFLWEKGPARSNFWFYTIKVEAKHKTDLIQFLLSRKIQVRPVWKLIHSLPMYSDYQAYKIDNSIKIYDSCINLPCSLNLTDDQIQFVAGNIKSYFGNS